MKRKFLDWYRGKYISPPENDPNSQVVFFSPGHYERSTGAKILAWLVQFWRKEWKYICGVMGGLIWWLWSKYF